MSVIAASRKNRTLGSRAHPWDTLYVVNANGETVSLREALLGVDRGGGFFHRDSFGVNVLFDPEGVDTPSPTLPSGANEWVAAPYTGQDLPGTGDNTLLHGQMRQWTTIAGGTRTFLLMRTMSGDYRTVETTNWDD